MTASELPANWCKHSALIYKPRKEAKFYVICAPLPSGTCSITMVCYDDTLKQYPWLKPPRDSQQSWTKEQWKRNHLSMENDSDGVIRVELAEKLEEMFQVEMPGFLKAGIDKKTLQTATIHPRVSWLDMNLPQNEIDTVGGSRRNDDGVKLERDNSFVTGDAKYSTPGGGIVLVGDSCHACTASLGQGCNLALESAMALANSIDEIYSPSSSLETISVDDLSTAFSNYGETRPEVARPIQTASSAASKLSHKW